MKAVANAPTNRVIRRIRIRAMLFLVLALAAGAGAIVLVKGYLDRQRAARATPVSTTPVAVAALDIPIGTTLTQEHLSVVQWPNASLPAGTFTDSAKLVGRTPVASLVKGEPILHGRLADEKAGRGLTALLKKGTRAMAVKVDQVIGLAGFVQPGDYVDVITTMTPDEETNKAVAKGGRVSKVSKIILQNIRVLTVGQHMTTQGSKPVKYQEVNLEVTPEQSERLALASRHGEIQLTMRSRIDQQEVPTVGVTPLALLSPDDGAELKTDPAASAEARDKESERRWLAMRAARRRQAKKKEEPPKPAAPVVEVLRGDRVEERKLKPTADSK